MSAEYREWENDINNLLKPHKISIVGIPDEVLTAMYWDDLSSKQAADTLIAANAKYADKFYK